MDTQEKHGPIESAIRQMLELMEFSGDTAGELSEAELDLVVAAVSAPEYQKFIREARRRREEKYAETNRGWRLARDHR